jgi:AcrR family transcriptional regulator
MARRIGSDGTRTRIAIRDAAIRLIARVGYEALSMRRLAEEVGLGAAALYRYFPTKQAMLFDLLDGHMDDLLQAWADADPGTVPSPPERLRAFATFHMRHHYARADSLFLSYMELRSLDPDNFRRIEDQRRSYERAIADIIAAGVATGDFHEQDPRVTARAIIALLNGLPVWYRADGPLGRDAVETLYLNMVAGLVGSAYTKEKACFTPA